VYLNKKKKEKKEEYETEAEGKELRLEFNPAVSITPSHPPAKVNAQNEKQTAL